MNLRERVKHLEAWYDKQEKIEHLTRYIYEIQKEITAIKDFLGIKIVPGSCIVKKTKGEQDV